MKIINLLFVIVCLISIVYCQTTTILTKYVSVNSGIDGYQCGYENSPCKSIVGAVKSSDYQYYSNYEIQVILMSGTYTSINPTNLFGLNISISAQLNSQVEFLTSKSSYDVVTPHFIVDAGTTYNTRSTNIKFSGFSISGSGIKGEDTRASFLHVISDPYNQKNLNIQVDNVLFNSITVLAPYFSLTSKYSQSSSSISQDDNDSSSNDDAQKLNNNNYYTSGSSSSSSQSSSDDNEYSYSSTDNNNNNYNYNNQYTVQQYWGYQSYPTDQINNTFIFNNCEFGSTSVSSDLLFQSESEFIVELLVSSSVFNDIYLEGGSIISITGGGRALIENSQFNDIYASDNMGILFNFVNTRIGFNKVDLTMSRLGSFIVLAQSSLLTANSFNVNASIPYITVPSFKFIDTMATFENCTHYFYNPDNENYYYSSTSSVYQLSNSELYLLSNRISSNITNLVYSIGSSVWTNNNLLSVNYNSKLVVCNSDSFSRIHDATGSLNGYTTGCDNNNDLDNVQFDITALLLAFFAGILSIVLLFIVIFSISAICKCRKRKRNQLKSSEQTVRDNENVATAASDTVTPHNEKSKLLSINTVN